MLNEEYGSDTDDDDYVPEGDGHEASEEENSGDDENNTDGNAKKKKKVKKTDNVFLRGAFAAEGSTDWEKDLEEERKERNEVEEKKKAEDLWADFKSDVGTKKPAPPPKKPSSIASLFGSAESSSSKPETATQSKPKSRLSSLFDTTPEPVSSSSKEATVKPKARNTFSSLFDSAEDKKTENETVSASASDQVESEESADKSSSSKVEITKVFDFAGEVVKVTKEVDATSSEAKKFLKQQDEAASTGVKRPGGLASVVGNINKKTKMGCLDKSKLDWNSFVAEEGIKEELASFNRGKDGFVEKQMFLERADLRQFEIEKAIRDKNRKSLMK